MAESAIGPAVNWVGSQIGTLLLEEARFLYGVDMKVEELQEEIEWMECFLRDSDAIRDGSARVQKWVTKIRDLANEAEDIVDIFVHKVLSRSQDNFMNKLKRYSCIINEAKDLHKIGNDIDSLKNRITTLNSRLQAYGVKLTDRGDNSSLRREVRLRTTDGNLQNEKYVIGLDKDVKIVVDKLLEENSSSKIVALCGMGGLGKTTLAKKVYHDKQVREQFQAFAWAYVSQQCQTKSILTELLASIDVIGEAKTEPQLIAKLNKVLMEKNCLVILDDIWSDDDWELLKAALQNVRGKVMLTTRNEDVPKHADQQAYIHRQEILSPEDAWKLLDTKLRSVSSSNIFEGTHGPRKEELAREMVQHCKGLPLAIVALGGVLVKKERVEEWESVRDHINLILLKAKDGGLSSEELLELSYNDLPYHLKPCFLYLGIFPEDAEIPVGKLVQLWIAEGFVSLASNEVSSVDQQEEGSYLSDKGEIYLRELVDRSMVQVGEINYESGKLFTCRVHDLVRELCLSKAAQENFLKVVKGSKDCNSRGTYRRLAIQDEEGWRHVDLSTSSTSSGKHVKSLIFTGALSYSSDEHSLQVMAKLIIQFQSLRVLDLEDSSIRYLPKEVGDMVFLRYLSINGSLIRMVPSSIGKLRCLQTLDLRSFCGLHGLLPSNVLKRMKQLRQLFLPRRIVIGQWRQFYMESKIGSKFPLSKLSFDGLHNLETVCNFQPRFHQLKDIGKLTNLSQLVIGGIIDNIEDIEILKNSQNISSGRVKLLHLPIRGHVLVENQNVFSSLSEIKIKKIFIEITGELRSRTPSDHNYCLSPHMLPDNLTVLILSETCIEKDPMPVLEKLPNLEALHLSIKSYTGQEMICSRDGFPRLTLLEIFLLDNLKKWVIEEGAMQSLQLLSIGYCKCLREFPDGIKYIPNLQRLEICRMSKTFCDGARAMHRDINIVDEAIQGEEHPPVRKTGHIPLIEIRHER